MDEAQVLASMSPDYRAFIAGWERSAAALGMPGVLRRLVEEAYVLGYRKGAQAERSGVCEEDRDG